MSESDIENIEDRPDSGDPAAASGTVIVGVACCAAAGRASRSPRKSVSGRMGGPSISTFGKS
jgi:hypothetical protein